MDNNYSELYELYEKLKKSNAVLEPLSPAKIKAIRKSYNLSQLGFAKMLKIKVKTLQNYEIGRTTPPSTATALFILARDHPELFNECIEPNSKPFMY
ncbi:Virulence gene repressor RsaL [Candidatus Jidaibacter acanthamoeba]|uniref:Virulence gene repressor RsaL n=1 Tax=Candidatus Jidaibacter acanthamoebae TaxID=86105 RepID=A0A0C1QZG4_9RICK|nr:type II toxin-antitoxin system MqsA family antitoxin [Candidatus Jidaibacter acanthamoeba]KIE05430.1 Virulence gene repressor RsaL [Candidatus Jidaibacter acanthamoeba]